MSPPGVNIFPKNPINSYFFSGRSNLFLVFCVKCMFANYVFHKIDLDLFHFKYNLMKSYGGSNLFLVLSLRSNKFLVPGASNSGSVFTLVFKRVLKSARILIQ